MSDFAKTRERNPNGTFTKPTLPSIFDGVEYRKRYHLLNREDRIRKSVEWGRKNKDRRKIIKDRWVSANREKVNFLKRQYMYRRKQIIKGLESDKEYPTPLQISELYAKHLDLCVYCNLNKATTIDHVIPLSRGGRNNIDNLLPACVSCNSSKGSKLLKEWKPELYE